MTVLVVAACSDGGGSGDRPDAGADAGPDAAAELEIAAPAAAALPDLLPCPEGWREVTVEDDPPTCEPWPEDGWQSCPAGQAHFPGEPGCEPLGAPCPAGDWPEGLPAEDVLYVSTTGAKDGDGTLLSPFRSVGDALRSRAAVPGSTIALAKGSYAEVVAPRFRVTIAGACAAETRIEGADYGGQVLGVAVLRPGLVLRDLTLGATLYVSADADAEVHGVAIEGASGVGVSLEGQLTATELMVRGTRALADGLFGEGIGVQPGGSVSLTRSVLLDNLVHGLIVEGGTATLEGVAIRGTRSEVASGQFGRGIQAFGGSTLSIGSSVLEDNRDMAITVFDAGTTFTMSDSVVRGTRGAEVDGHRGRGVNLVREVDASLERVLIEDNREFGLLVQEPGTECVVDHAVVRDTLPDEADGVWGYGTYVISEAHARLDHVLSARDTALGVFVALGGSLDAADLTIRRTRPSQDDAADFALGSSGFGLQEGASAEVARLGVEGITGIAVFLNATDDAPVDAHIADLVVTGTGSEPSTGAFGRSVDVENGATLELERARIEHGREGGIFAIGNGSRVELRDLVIDDIADAECVEAGCEGGEGMGLSSSSGAAIEVTSFRIARASLCGIQVAGGELDLHDGEVTDSPIGANVQDEDFDVGRLQDRVRYLRIERTLDGAALPVPRPILPPL